ncbi:hypothetical protein [Bacillus fonticola]|uniref:hypothetical protein n=1 Tax=Bacillus fonticola TaxID=2728853 RepID=UPI001D14BFC1|nr:hypothetical protein [Bacillus fonticola]
MLKEYGFSTARKNFTTVFDDVQNYIPSLIRARKQTETDGIMISRLVLAEILERYPFEIDIRLEEDGSYWVWIQPINEYATGNTEAECRQAAVEVAREFAEDLINEPFMFQAKNTRPLIPYAMRILLCDNSQEVEQLLFGAELAEV